MWNRIVNKYSVLLLLFLFSPLPVRADGTSYPRRLIKALAVRGGLAQWNRWFHAQTKPMRWRGAQLQGMPLRGWRCRGCDLQRGRFQRARLRGADLRGADLRFASLEGASLRHVDLRAADLSWADLSGADLRQAKLDGTKLVGALFSGTTKWPRGFLPPAAGGGLPGSFPTSQPIRQSSSRPARSGAIPEVCPFQAVSRCVLWRRCVAGEAKACSRVAKLYLFGDQQRPDFRHLYRSSKQRCEKGAKAGCLLLGWLRWHGWGTRRSRLQAMQTVNKACTLGSALACTALGLALWYQEGLRGGGARSQALLLRACERGDATGCLLASLSGLRSADGGIRTRSRRWLKRSCWLGASVACLLRSVDGKRAGGKAPARKQTWRLGCKQGRGVSCLAEGAWGLLGGDSKTLPMTATSLRRSCNLGHSTGCLLYGMMRLLGAGRNRNPRIASQAFRRGCETQGGLSCLLHGHSFAAGWSGAGGVARGRLLLQQRCLRNQREACLGLSLTFFASSSVERNSQRAGPFYRRACQLRSANDCYQYAVLHDHRFNPRQLVTARAYFGRACTQGVAKACWLLGYYYRAGVGVRKNPTLGYAFHERACKLGLSYGCFNVGSMWESGEGRKRDCRAARMHYKRACSLGFSPGCKKTCK